MELISDLDTPALLVDLDIADANVRRMAERARRAGVSLRPHIKTHKTPALAHLQIKAGAIGVTAAKLGEAEVMAASGIDDILVAYPIVGERKIQRLLRLARSAKVTNALDHLDVAEGLSRAFEAAGMKLDVLVELDSGYGRCGLAPGQAAAQFVRALVRLPGLRFRGFMVLAGEIYKAPTDEEKEKVARREIQIALDTANLLAADGLKAEIISVGSTDSARFMERVRGATEYRPGAYIFNDMSVVDYGAAALEECSLTVLATVVSLPAPGRVIVDAGSKSLTHALAPKTPGYGYIKGWPGAVIERLSEEHGIVRMTQGWETLRIGARVEIIPNYCSDVINYFDQLVAVRSKQVEAVWPILARGKNQ